MKQVEYRTERVGLDLTKISLMCRIAYSFSVRSKSFGVRENISGPRISTLLDQ